MGLRVVVVDLAGSSGVAGSTNGPLKRIDKQLALADVIRRAALDYVEL
jgi:hypothetical protein